MATNAKPEKDEQHSEPASTSESGPDSSSHLATQLLPELKRIARAHMRRERQEHTLQPTALVNELFVQLLQRDGEMKERQWTSREHFLLSASRAMQHLLVDHARARGAGKRGGDWVRVEFDDPAEAVSGQQSIDMLTLAELLSRLEAEEPRMAEVVRLRFYSGLTLAEISGVLGVHEKTIKRDWALARHWLRGHLELE